MNSKYWIFILILASAPLSSQVKTGVPQTGNRRPAGTSTLPSPDPLTEVLTAPSVSPTPTFQETEFLPFTEYRMGAEDLISVQVLDAPEFTRLVRVSGTGTIKLPLVQQPIPAAGKTSAELEREIAQALIQEGLLREPTILVTVREFHSKPISVSGAVRSPIVFQASRPLTLIEAISRAGGLTETAGPEVVVSTPGLESRSANVVRIATKSLMEMSDPKANMILRGGEEVRIPSAGRVYVIGGVTRPGPVLVAEEQGLTLLQAVAMVGGTLPTASSKALLIRSTPGATKQELSFSLKKLMRGQLPDVPLQPNDLVFIADSHTKRVTQAGMAAAMTSFMYGAAGVLLWR